MKVFSENENYKLYLGTMLDMGEVIQPNSIDSIVTDPPYGLTTIVKRFGKENSAPAQYGKDGSFSRLSKGFMGKEWDGSGIEYNVSAWYECYKALKPGGYLLAFGGSRTFYRIACAIEDAGFEIRDTIMWLYGSGFPKSMNIGLAIDKKEGLQGQRGIGGFNVGGIQEQNNRKAKLYIGSTTDGSKQEAYTDYKSELSKQWAGWGTALKPSFEPIIVARKPFKGSLVDNVLEYGVGGLNIDECRIGDEVISGGTMPDFRDVGQKSKESIGIDKLSFGQVTNAERKEYEDHIGRFPANTILTYDDTDFEEVCGGMQESEHRYFYCAKANQKDRDEGLYAFEEKVDCDRNPAAYSASTAFNRSARPKKNTHPTVKPTDLMQYLVRLVTPKQGIVLDPFNGSGSTGKAVMFENKERNAGYKYIGIDLEEEYLEISKARIDYVISGRDEETEIITKDSRQLDIFDYL